MINRIYEAWWYGCETYHIATFFDRKAADAFCKTINDECQAEVMEIEEIPLFDYHGYPVTPAEYFYARN